MFDYPLEPSKTLEIDTNSILGIAKTEDQKKFEVHQDKNVDSESNEESSEESSEENNEEISEKFEIPSKPMVIDISELEDKWEETCYFKYFNETERRPDLHEAIEDLK